MGNDILMAEIEQAVSTYIPDERHDREKYQQLAAKLRTLAQGAGNNKGRFERMARAVTDISEQELGHAESLIRIKAGLDEIRSSRRALEQDPSWRSSGPHGETLEVIFPRRAPSTDKIADALEARNIYTDKILVQGNSARLVMNRPGDYSERVREAIEDILGVRIVEINSEL